jgi:hypothetical protein
MTSLEKLLNEVQVILRQLTQNNNTEFHLEINPYIKQIVELARAEGKRPNAGMLLFNFTLDTQFSEKKSNLKLFN